MSTETENETVPFRYVVVRGVAYLRSEDVAEYLREIGGAEEADTRKRLEVAATSLQRHAAEIRWDWATREAKRLANEG